MSSLQEIVLHSWRESVSQDYRQTIMMECLNSTGQRINVDISEYIGGCNPNNPFKRPVKLYFGLPHVASLPDNDPFNPHLEQWDILYRKLYNSCTGCKIIRYGSYKAKEYAEEQYPLLNIACHRAKTFQRNKSNNLIPSIESQNDLIPFRAETVTNNYRNDRENGHKDKKRKCETTRPLNTEERCKFNFVVGYDSTNGYFLACNKGNNIHNGHSIDLSWQSRPVAKAVDPKYIESVKSLGSINATSSISRTLLLSQSGSLLSNAQIKYITRLSGSVTAEFGTSMEPKELMLFFRERNVSFIALLNGKRSPSVSPSSFIEAYNGQQNSEITTSDDMANNEDMENFCMNERLNVDDEVILFQAIAWSTIKERQFYDKFPMVINIDASAQTNREKRPLVTVTARSIDSKWYPVLRCLLPNEQQWSFRWLFTQGFSTLLGADWTRHTVMAVTDGDSNEISQLSHAISDKIQSSHQVVPGPILRRCAVHIILKGLEKYGPRKTVAVGPAMNTPAHLSYKKIMTTINDWLFSFTKPHVIETEEECNISEQLLLAYVKSDFVQTILGLEATRLQECLTRYILPHVSTFAQFRYSHVRSFGVHSNNAVEGTHNAYKSSGISVMPSDSLCKMTDKLLTQSDIKHMSSTRRIDTEKTWVHSGTSAFLNTTAEYELASARIRLEEYECVRVGTFMWRVAYTKTREPTASIIPWFHRVREISMSSDGYLKCTCKHFETFGVGCVHMLKTIQHENASVAEYKVTDTSVIWWKRYYSTEPVSSSPAWDELINLRMSDVVGPRMPKYDTTLSTLSNVVTDIPDRFIVRPAIERCINYSHASIDNLWLSRQVTNVKEQRKDVRADVRNDDSKTGLDENSAEINGKEIKTIVHEESNRNQPAQDERNGNNSGDNDENHIGHNDDDTSHTDESESYNDEAAYDPYESLKGHFSHLCEHFRLLKKKERYNFIQDAKDWMNKKASSCKSNVTVDTCDAKDSGQIMMSTNMIHVVRKKQISKSCGW
jgi:hypothetical protein